MTDARGGVPRAGLVTGASSGIGRAMAGMLSSEGYNLTIAARRPEQLEATAAALRDTGVEVAAVPTDVTRPQDIAALVERHRETFDRLDVLVNCAGGGETGIALRDASDELIGAHLDLNLRSYILMTRAALPLLRAAGAEHGKALVVNVGSMAGVRPGPGISCYAAAKAGMIAMTESVQREELHSGVQLTHFSPGMTATALSSWMSNAGIGPEEMVQPEDLAEAMRFLLRTSPTCRVRAIEFTPPGQEEFIERVVAYQETIHAS